MNSKHRHSFLEKKLENPLETMAMSKLKKIYWAEKDTKNKLQIQPAYTNIATLPIFV